MLFTENISKSFSIIVWHFIYTLLGNPFRKLFIHELSILTDPFLPFICNSTIHYNAFFTPFFGQEWERERNSFEKYSEAEFTFSGCGDVADGMSTKRQLVVARASRSITLILRRDGETVLNFGCLCAILEVNINRYI
jgi:hypothetical protein